MCGGSSCPRAVSGVDRRFQCDVDDLDVYAAERWRDDALSYPEVKKPADLVAQGWTDAIRHLHPDQRLYTF